MIGPNMNQRDKQAYLSSVKILSGCLMRDVFVHFECRLPKTCSTLFELVLDMLNWFFFFTAPKKPWFGRSVAAGL